MIKRTVIRSHLARMPLITLMLLTCFPGSVRGENDIAILADKGRSFYRQRRYPEARTALEKAVLVKKEADIYYFLGNTYFMLGQTRKSEGAFREALKLDPHCMPALQNLGRVLYKGKKYQECITVKNLTEAEKILKLLLAKDSFNLKAYEHLGPIYLSQNKLKEAATCYEKIVTLKEKPVEEYLLLGNIFLYFNNPKRAIDFYEKALEIDSNDIRSYNGLGAAYSILSRWDKAIIFYQKVLKLDAKNEEAKQGLLYALKRDIKGIRANIDVLSGASPPARRRGDTGVFTQD